MIATKHDYLAKSRDLISKQNFNDMETGFVHIILRSKNLQPINDLIKQGRKIMLPFLLFISSAGLFGCNTAAIATNDTPQKDEAPSELSTSDAEDLLVVDCLLPGRVRNMGRRVFLSPRRPIKTTALDCRERGGQYVPYSQRDVASALEVWLPEAKEGNEVAQTEVGEIYEKGIGTQPSYGLATEWYQKAAAQGYPRAQINLGYLYEKGLGVKKDVTTATEWYQRASGLRASIAAKTGRQSDEPQQFKPKVDLREIKMNTLRQKIADKQKEIQTDHAFLLKRKEAAEVQRRKLDETRRELEIRKKQVDPETLADLKRLEAEQKKREADLLAQRQEAFKMQQKIDSLEAGKQQQVEKEQEALRREREDLAQLLKALEIEQQKMEATLQELEQKKKRVDTEAFVNLKALETEKEKRETELSQQLRENDLLREKIASLETGINDLHDELSKVRAEKEAVPQTEPIADESYRPPKQLIKKLGRYYALVIGNNKYANLSNLETAENDAKRASEILTNKYGFKTRTLFNANRYEILSALNEFTEQLTEKDNFLLYYAGHGELDVINLRGYWLPVDAEKNNPTNWIPDFAITDILNVMSAKHVMVIADSCYAGIMTYDAITGLQSGFSDEVRDYWLEKLTQKRSRTVFTSGGTEPVSDVGGGNNSVFAKFLFDFLETNSEFIDGRRLYKEITPRVSYASHALKLEQEPQYAAFKGHEGSDFFFVPVELRANSNYQLPDSRPDASLREIASLKVFTNSLN
ncbi:MAG: caspase family protein [Desulfobacterales bacterium]